MSGNASVKTCPIPVAIPIIFVPGIMGSRLRNTALNKIVWDPDSYWWIAGIATDGAQTRRRNLIGESGEGFSSTYLAVETGTEKHLKGKVKVKSQIPEKLARGWGGVAWGFYGGFLTWLETSLVSAMGYPEGCSSIKVEAWAHPYNWTDDNLNAADELLAVVQRAKAEAIAEHEPNGTKVLEPIVITHSMGGLVGRAFAKLKGGESECHAVIHGAMPTHGSPAAYKRMCAGFEGVSSVALGYSSGAVTPILANAPGGLELLPNQFHKSSSSSSPQSKWLRITQNGTLLDSFPKSGNPYREIYANNTDWWRLIDRSRIDPAARSEATAWFQYLSSLSIASSFHTQLGDSKFHKNTKALYADTDDNQCWDEVTWETEGIREVTMPENPSRWSRPSSRVMPHPVNPAAFSSLEVSDNGLGERYFEVAVPPNSPTIRKRFIRFNIEPATANGDGTVHSGSGKHLPAGKVDSEATQSNGRNVGYAHDAVFDNAAVRRQVAGWVGEMVETMINQA